jgi:hypothetical protein
MSQNIYCVHFCYILVLVIASMISSKGCTYDGKTAYLFNIFLVGTFVLHVVQSLTNSALPFARISTVALVSCKLCCGKNAVFGKRYL